MKQNIKEPAEAAAVFYRKCLRILNDLGAPYLVGGTFAVNAYTGINRETKDLDIFTKPGEYPKIISAFREKGYKTAVLDERWLAKISEDRYYMDIVFGSGNAVVPITEEWFKRSRKLKIFDTDTAVLPVTELILSKLFGMERRKYDGNDIAHLILRHGKEVDWRRLLGYADQYWEVLLVHILNFRFIYPSERERIPHELLEELLSRLDTQVKMPTSQVKICRGRLLSSTDFEIDVREWGFADIIGAQSEKAEKPSKAQSEKGDDKNAKRNGK